MSDFLAEDVVQDIPTDWGSVTTVDVTGGNNGGTIDTGAATSVDWGFLNSAGSFLAKLAGTYSGVKQITQNNKAQPNATNGLGSTSLLVIGGAIILAIVIIKKA